MITFLQTYGFWIFFIVLFLLMMRMRGGQSGHGMGGCCGMGEMEHDQQQGDHQHTDSVPKSDAGQRYQGRVRDLPTQEEEKERNEDEPYVAAQHAHRH